MIFIGQISSSIEDNLKKINEKSSIEEKITLYELIGEDYLEKSDYPSFRSFDKAVKEKYGDNELIYINSLKFNVQHKTKVGQYDSAFILLKKIEEAFPGGPPCLNKLASIGFVVISFTSKVN